MFRILTYFIVACLFAVLAGGVWLTEFANRTQRDGSMQLPALEAPVTIWRDKNLTPYIEAQSIADALRAQGFLVGQERLYQVQLFRLLALGRVSEVAGDKGIAQDTLVRSLNLEKLADKWLESLDSAAIEFYQHYIDGLNAYIRLHQQDHALAPELLGISAETWTIQDIVALQLFQAWSNASLWKNELLTQKLIDAIGVESTQQIAQISRNPVDGSWRAAQLSSATRSESKTNQTSDLGMQKLDGLSAGSNAWATGRHKSANQFPVLANNPHLPSTTLPGFWVPLGIFTPNFKSVGLIAAGSPGIGIGRNETLAWGGTVGGGDGVDLFIEELDSAEVDHYIENGVSLPLEVRQETIMIKDDSQESGFRTEQITIRNTPRGPLITDFDQFSSHSRPLSLRWALAEVSGPSLGLDRLWRAKDVTSATLALRHSPSSLSQILADREGNIARISTGQIPIRLRHDGSHPVAADQGEAWRGNIPPEQMPAETNPERDWVATANHRVLAKDYPHAFSSDFAASWRMDRIQSVLAAPGQRSTQEHWALLHDIYNPMAERLRPAILDAMSNDQKYSPYAKLLQEWSLFDTTDSGAAALFQVIYRHLAKHVFEDELPTELAKEFFDSERYWEERLVMMVNTPDHPWFDNRSTPTIETLDNLWPSVFDDAIAELQSKLGSDPKHWNWGELHPITFYSPVIPGQTAANWLGGGTREMDGSGHTVNRSKYLLSDTYNSRMIDSVRMLIDLSDDEKILVNIPGGPSGRYFDDGLDNLLEGWFAGEPTNILFDLENVRAAAKHKLQLNP